MIISEIVTSYQFWDQLNTLLLIFFMCRFFYQAFQIRPIRRGSFHAWYLLMLCMHGWNLYLEGLRFDWPTPRLFSMWRTNVVWTTLVWIFLHNYDWYLRRYVLAPCRISTHLLTSVRSFYMSDLAYLTQKKWETCSICFESLRIGQARLNLSCRHQFHWSCLQLSILHGCDTCPLCRQSFSG